MREESETGDDGESMSENIKEKKKEFLDGRIERNGEGGNQRGITEKLKDKEEQSIGVHRKSDYEVREEQS